MFNVHRYFFKKHAPSFAAEYLQDVAEQPIRLSGITTIDFERFLTMIYPSCVSLAPTVQAGTDLLPIF